MKLYDTDGQALPIQAASGGGGSSSGWEYHWNFLAPLDPNTVGAAEIDGHRVEF